MKLLRTIRLDPSDTFVYARAAAPGEWAVPGAFELPMACRRLAQSGLVDALIMLGAVVRGGTDHYDYVCSGVTDGAMRGRLH